MQRDIAGIMLKTAGRNTNEKRSDFFYTAFWFILLSMKYVLIFVAVVALAQIDALTTLIRRAGETFTQQKERLTGEASTAPMDSNEATVSIQNDPSLKITPHARVIALMDAFRLNPESSLRSRVLEEIAKVPKFREVTLDPLFESAVFSWRDLVLHQHVLTLDLLLDLEAYLQGENQQAVRKVLTVLLDGQTELFLRKYQRSKDVNCKGIIYFIDPIPEEEKINEYLERDLNVAAVLQKENLEPAFKSFVTLCQLVLHNVINPPAPLAPVVAPTTDSSPAPLAVPPTPTPVNP